MPRPSNEDFPDVTLHESVYVDPPCEIGRGTRIWHFSHVMEGSRIGRDCNLGQNVVISPGVVLGNRVKIQNNVSVYEGVTLEDDVFCGPSMVFTNVINPRSEIPRKNEYRETRVRTGATLGANSTVVCGVEIGNYALVGAGAVVTQDVPPYALMLGVPARRAGWVCRCGVTLAATLGSIRCGACGNLYEASDDTLKPVRETQASRGGATT
jgi:UDP-2-acetamido-3-amino-2,3-dideoxy-glucuronate N-acetyltransferase